jgi:hypothetical protein
MNLWCDEQIVVSIDGPEGSREVLVPAPLARIGAHPESDVVLSGVGVAKRALYLHATSVGLYVLNLDLEDANLEQRGRWLRPTEVLTIGEFRLRARTQSALAAPAGLAELVARGSSPPPVPVLDVYCGRLLKDKRRFRSRLSLLGRRPQCSLRLRGARVSSFHCALYWEQRRLWCIDLLSSNGTQLNGVPLRCDEVRLNDRLEIGEFELEYHRWSPRLSMAPGWQPQARAETPEEDSPSSTDALADAPVVSGARPADSGSSVLEADAAAEQQRSEQLAEQMARLTSERLELQRQSAEASRQLAARIDELQAASKKLSQECAAHETARAQWQDERALLTKDAASQQQLHEQLADEIARLTGEQLDWQQQLAARNDELKAESLKLSQERAAHEMARKQWQTERASLAAGLASRSELVARLKSELAAATSALAQRTADEESIPTAGPSASQHAEMSPVDTFLPAEALPKETIPAEACEAKALSDKLTPRDVAQVEPLPQPVPLSIAESAADWTAERAALPANQTDKAAPPADEQTLIKVPPTFGRRGKPARQEMSTYISDRLSELQETKSHKTLVLVAAIGAATLTISAALLGAWMWLH